MSCSCSDPSPSSAHLPVLAEANVLGVMCGHGIDGTADQVRDLISRNPIEATDGLTEAVLAGYETTAPDRLVVRRHLKAVEA